MPKSWTENISGPHGRALSKSYSTAIAYHICARTYLSRQLELPPFHLIVGIVHILSSLRVFSTKSFLELFSSLNDLVENSINKPNDSESPTNYGTNRGDKVIPPATLAGYQDL